MSMLNLLLGVAVNSSEVKTCVNPQPGLVPAMPGALGNEAEGPASVISKIRLPPPLTKNWPTCDRAGTVARKILSAVLRDHGLIGAGAFDQRAVVGHGRAIANAVAGAERAGVGHEQSAADDQLLSAEIDLAAGIGH